MNDDQKNLSVVPPALMYFLTRIGLQALLDLITPDACGVIKDSH